MYKEKTIEVLNRGHANNGGGRVEENSTSPLRSSSNGRPVNPSYGIMSGQNEPGFARSPLQVNKRPPNVQPSFYVKQELERMENPDEGGEQKPVYSPLRSSPGRGRSNSPSRVAAALQESHGPGATRTSFVQQQNRESRSPIDNNR